MCLYVCTDSPSPRVPRQKPPLGTPSFLLGRCHGSSRRAAAIAACDGEAVQYVAGKGVDHVAGEDEPGAATDNC